MPGKWTLNTLCMQEDFFSDAALIGISAPLPAYQFCWLLNEHFATEFVRDAEQDICLQVSKEEQRYFAVYNYATPMNGPRYVLYKLKTGKQALLPEAKGLDYIWMVQGSCPTAHAEHLSGLLRSLPDVQLAQVLEPKKLKNLGHLVM